jgi:lipoprotein-anchoring transpeptidase ErfK/SrfK
MRRRNPRLAQIAIFVFAAIVIVIGLVAHSEQRGGLSQTATAAQAGQPLGGSPLGGSPAATSAGGDQANDPNALPPADGDGVDDSNPVDTTPVDTSPDETTTTLPQYSLNAIPPSSGTGRRIVVANTANMLWVVGDDGKMIDSWLVSGKPGVPYVGTYHVMSKARYSHGILGHEDISMEYATRFAISPNRKNTLDFHAIPYRGGKPMQTEAQLGTWQSGGCVRMTKDHAAWIFNWADIGTKVVILK